MSPFTPAVPDIEEAVRQYLLLHPHAVDTERGVREWWLRESCPHCAATDVHTAIENLVAKGELVECKLPDGQVAYAASKATAPPRFGPH